MIKRKIFFHSQNEPLAMYHSPSCMHLLSLLSPQTASASFKEKAIGFHQCWWGVYGLILNVKHHLGCCFECDVMRGYTASNHDIWLEDTPGQHDIDLDPFKSFTTSIHFTLWNIVNGCLGQKPEKILKEIFQRKSNNYHRLKMTIHLQWRWGGPPSGRDRKKICFMSSPSPSYD